MRKIYNTSIQDMIIEKKNQLAKYLLETSNNKIKQIADLTGYEDQYYFSRIFRRKTGMSPSKYQLRYRR